MRLSPIYILLCALFCYSHAYAGSGNPAVHGNPVQPRPALFMENVGQIRDQFDAPRKDVDYSISLENVTVYIGRGTLHYQFLKHARGRNTRAKAESGSQSYRMDVSLSGAGGTARPQESGRSEYFEQFYNLERGLDGAVSRSCSRIMYTDVYPGIDWVLYTREDTLEYDFVVHPGADPRQIRINYGGATKLRKAADGSLNATTRFGTVSEHAPVAYEQESGKSHPVQFVVNGKTAGFDLGPVARTTIIDPAIRVWGTYYGGFGEDYAYAVTTDSAGNVYMGGSSRNSLNMVTTGAHQTTITGSPDALLVKFNSAGTRLWATFYGGSGYEDVIYDLAVDGSGNVYATGLTESSTGIATTGAHRFTFTKPFARSGQWDAFLVKFSSAGVRQWGTYYGDSLQDIGRAVVCDEAGNVYIGGETANAIGIATSGSYQPTYNNGDAFIAKFNPAGQRIWGSYYGSNGIDKILDLCYDKYSKSIYMVGQTNSPTGIATSGAVQSTCFEPISLTDFDGFVMRIDTASRRKWGTYYGSYSHDAISGVAADGNGAVYITGNCGPGLHLVTPGAYQTRDNGGGVLARFDTGGVRQWGTFIYSASGVAVTTGTAGDVFVTGATNSASFGLSTRGSFQLNASSSSGSRAYDGFVMKFSPDGQRIWGSYYGSNADEFGRSISYNKATNSVYFCGTTITGYFTYTSLGSPGAHQSTSPGGYSAGFVTRFANDTNAYIRLPFFDTLLCAGTTIPIAYGADTFRPGNVFSIELSDLWGSFGAGATIVGTATATTGGVINCTIPATAAATSYYKMRILATNPVDTSEVTPYILMGTPISGVTSASGNAPVCSGDTLRLSASYAGTGTTTHFQWVGPNGYFDTARHPVILRPDTGRSGKYYVTAMNGGCKAATDSLIVTVKPLPDTVAFRTSTPICAGDTLHFYGTSTPGALISWTGLNGFADTGTHVFIPSVTSAASDWYFVSATLNGCRSPKQQAKSLMVLPGNGVPGVSVSVSPGSSIPWGTAVVFTATSTNAGTAPGYQWRINGTPVPGETAAVFTTTTLTEGDVVSVILRSGLPCSRPDTAVSTPITMHVTVGITAAGARSWGLSVYPNPANGNFNVQGRLPANADAGIEILDVSGRVIHRETARVSDGLLQTKISLGRSIAPGVYLLRVTQGEVRASAGFAIQ